MIKNKIFVAMVGSIFSVFSCAGTLGNDITDALKKGVTLSVGPAWSDPGKTQTISFSPTFFQTYVVRSSTATLGSGEVFLHVEKDIMSTLQAQLGLAVAATTSIPLQGEIWQDNDPDFNNFNYSYKISHAHVAVRTKLFKELQAFVKPYIGASIGVGFNRTYHYVDTPKLSEVVSEPPFSPNTNTAFTYTLDLGIHKNLNEQWAVEIGYEFADWGRSYLGRASDQILGNGLNVNHVYTNALLLGLSFIA